MNNKYLQIVVLVLLAGLALFVIKRQPQSQAKVITDFQTCQQAGGAILDGEPVQCEAFDGRKFSAVENADPEVVLDMPKYGDLVASPLLVKGKARGNWFFEATIGVVLKDQNGKIIAQPTVMADPAFDWQTLDYVPFMASLEFATPETDTGVLIISKDNPSDMRQFDASFAVPVRFK